MNVGYIDYSKLWDVLEKKHKNKQYLINNGIHRNTLYNLVNNRSVKTEKIALICHLLNCQPKDIMEYVSNKESKDYPTNG